MKNYKKGLLTVAVLAAMSLMAAEDKVIKVTTFVDENGENDNACSLREAIKTAKLDKSFGGCNVGRRVATDGTAADVIQLEAGEYKLDGELVVESAVNIFGKDPLSYINRSPITNKYPTREALSTTISGQGKHRLFNTLASQAPLNISNIKLEQGYSNADGATFYIAGSLGIYNSEVSQAKADGEGAVVYAVAMDYEQNLIIQDSLIHNNIANSHGSVLAMDCIGNLGSTQTRVDIANSSIVNNGSNGTASILDFCGFATASLINTTLAKNTTRNDGHIISLVHTNQRPLTASSSLNLLSNTIVENTAKSTLWYDNRSSISLGYNLLAYNNGLSCEYALNEGVPSVEQLVLLSSVKNAIQTTGDSRCVLPERTASSTANDIDVSNISMSSILSSYIEPSITTRFLGLYYPRNLQTATDLVDVGSSGCADVDQRGIARAASATLILNPSSKNTCDIGSVEVRRLTAADVSDLKNSSLVELKAYYQSNIDELKALIENKETPAEELPGLNIELQEYEDLKKYTEQYQKYRAIYIDPFSLPLPDERLNGNSIELRVLNAENYDVILQKIGVGELKGEGDTVQLDGTVDDALKCEWKPDLKQIMMYRTDGKSTSATDYEFCSYTLKDKSSGNSSAGILKARFENIAPIAVSDEYIIRRENNLVVTVNPLENDSDDGDGPLDTINPTRKAFYHNEDGLETPIRIVKLPAGVELEAERQGPCPDDYQRETCYGGKLTFAVKNNLSQSSYSMEYNIFDAEEKISNTATINLKNSVRNTNTSSGGGSMGLWGIFALAGLALYRRYKS